MHMNVYIYSGSNLRGFKQEEGADKEKEEEEEEKKEEEEEEKKEGFYLDSFLNCNTHLPRGSTYNMPVFCLT